MMPHLDGLLISRSAEEVRLIVAHSAAVISSGAIESVEVLDTMPLEPGLSAVRVHYRGELLSPDAVGQKTDRDGRPDGVLPFVLASRQVPARLFSCPSYQALEKSFLDQAGLSIPETPANR